MAVLSVTESQQVDLAGTLHDVYEITFTIDGRPGSFNITVNKDGDPVNEAAGAIGAVEQQVNAIYGL